MPPSGSQVTHFEDPTTEWASYPPAPVPRSEGVVRLVTLFEPTPRSFPIEGETVIGRSHHATVCLSQTGISRRHARVVRDSLGQYVIEDLGSRNGTFVNGTRIKRHPLVFGDRIQIGHRAVLAFERASAEEERLAQHQKMEAIGRLSAGVAHEFNNFLAVIVSSLEYLGSLVGDEIPQHTEIVECLEDGLSAASQARLVTRQLLTFARPSEGLLRGVEIAGLLREVVQLVRRTFDRRVTVELETDNDLWVRGDRALLFQAILNLCLNARDAMQGDGRLSLSARKATRGGLWEGIVIEVADSGPGIDEQSLPRLFEPFYTTKDNSRGTGLGLAMVYGTVRNHGGDIDVVSRAGTGATFSIWLPDGAHHAITPTKTDRPSLASTPTSLPRVLVVDDEPLVRRSVQRVLKQVGHEVITASNGAEAVELYEKHGTDIGVIVLDLNMPVMTGRDALVRLKTLNPDVRVIVLSGYAHDEREELLSKGVSAVLDKPCDAKHLYRALREACA